MVLTQWWAVKSKQKKRYVDEDVAWINGHIK